MSKFCEDCGAKIDDANVNCPSCSNEKDVKNEVTNNQTSETNTNTTSKISFEGKNKNFVFLGIGAIITIIVLVILSSLLGGGYKKPINNMFKGMEKANLTKYLKAYPEFMGLDDYIDEEDMEDMLESLEDEYGKNIKISYKILDKEKIEKDDLEDVMEKIEKDYDTEVKIKKGYRLDVKSTVKGKKDSESSTSTMKVYKIKGKWYLLSF